MNTAMLLLAIATVILAGGSLWAAVHYGRKSVAANALASERSVVEWNVDRRDEDNAGWFFIANSGKDPAYEVNVVAWDGIDRVEVHAPVLVPYVEAQDSPTAERYIEFRLPHREKTGPKPVPGPPPRIPMPEPPPGSFANWMAESNRQQDEMIAHEIDRIQREQVWVRVTWRSTLGRWSTEELQTG